jgi:hypothetical protein
MFSFLVLQTDARIELIQPRSFNTMSIWVEVDGR